MWCLGHTLLPHRDGQPFLPQLNAFPLHLPPAPGGLSVLLGLWQGPSCRFVCESWATRHLLFSLKSFSENKEPVWSSAAVANLLDLTDHQGSTDHLLATAGPVCHVLSLCVSSCLRSGRGVDRRRYCAFSRPPPALLFTGPWVSCVKVGRARAGVGPSRPWGFGLFVGDQASIPVLVACPDAKTLCCYRI